MRLFKLLILSAILCSFTACGTDPGTGGHKPDPNCGNGTLDAGEECDGSKLRAADCAALDSSKIGKLTCDNTCHYVKTQCVPKPATCGNGTLDAGEDCDGTHLKETDCSKIDATKVGTLTCVVGGCTYNRSACTDKPTPHTVDADAPCTATDACKPDLACLPKGTSPDASICQPVNTLGCTKDGDCKDPSKKYCVIRRSMGKDISFCSAEKQCAKLDECGTDELCLSKDSDYSRGVCTKVTKCNASTDCDALAATLGHAMRCAKAMTSVPNGHSDGNMICVEDNGLQAGEHGCSATTPCQEGLICDKTSAFCTLHCSSEGFTPECTAGQGGGFCKELTDLNDKKVLGCAPIYGLNQTAGYDEECDNTSKFCKYGYVCVGTGDSPESGKCKPLCELDGQTLGLTTCTAAIGGTNCNVTIDNKNLTLASQIVQLGKFNDLNHMLKTCGQ